MYVWHSLDAKGENMYVYIGAFVCIFCMGVITLEQNSNLRFRDTEKIHVSESGKNPR